MRTAALTALALTACTSSCYADGSRADAGLDAPAEPDEDAAADAGDPVVEFFEALQAARCRALERCRGTPAEVCAARWREHRLALANAERAIAGGWAVLDETEAARCVAAYESDCAVFDHVLGMAPYFDLGLRRPGEPCARVTRPSGAPRPPECITADDCDATEYCSEAFGFCGAVGTCQPLVPPGGPCSGEVGPFACAGAPGGISRCAGGICETVRVHSVVTAGEACGLVGAELFVCAGPGLACGSTATGTLRCLELPHAGEPCGVAIFLGEPSLCYGRADCAGEPYVCTTTAPGSSCTNGCPGPGLRCDAGRCSVTTGTEGTGCDTLEDCEPPLVCDEGVCVRPLALGTGCRRDSVCGTECCGGGACVTPR